MTASYAISVRQASALPSASFRFHLAMDTLAVRLTVPPVGSVEDFHLQAGAPCRAHQKKAPENQGRRNPRFKSKSKNQASSVITLGKDVGEIAKHGKAAIAAATTKIAKRGRHDSPH